MNCLTPNCKGVLIWTEASPPWPAHYRCSLCGSPYNSKGKRFKRAHLQAGGWGRMVEKLKKEGGDGAQRGPRQTAENANPTAKEEVTEMEDKKKVCTRCKIEKVLSEFSINRANKDEHEGHCKACWIEKRRLKRESNGGKEKPAVKPVRRPTPTIHEKYLQGPKTTPELLAAADRLRSILQEMLAPIEKAVQEVKERFAL